MRQRHRNRCRLGNRQWNNFQRWRMDSSARLAPVDLETVNENRTTTSPKSSTKPIPKVTLGFVSAPSPCWLRNSQQKLVRYRLRNHHLKTFQSWRVDAEVLAAPVDSEKGQRKLSRCRLGNCQWNNFQRRRVDSSARPTPVDIQKVNEIWATIVSEIINESDSEGDAWIRQRAQPLLT